LLTVFEIPWFSHEIAKQVYTLSVVPWSENESGYENVIGHNYTPWPSFVLGLFVSNIF